MKLFGFLQKSARETSAQSLALQWPQPNATLIDVRTRLEWAQGHVQGAQNLDMMHDDFQDHLQQLDRQGTYYVMCRGGSRSAAAVRLMAELGFQKVFDVKGGIVNWKGLLVRA